ncbi:MAG TPA: hypothetical protein VNE39_23160 [Planctomycetota bacterium]|nr:hypothetical protein [Planctomycetota bacterium]
MDLERVERRPADFGLRYDWREGSLPPPYHYEYTICVSPAGEGTIVFRPDYPEEGAPAWEERFRVSGQALDELHKMMVERRVTADAVWETAPESDHVGGALEWLEVVAGGERYVVPSDLLHPEAMGPVYAFIRGLVPEAIWARLRARHEASQAAYGSI